MCVCVCVCVWCVVCVHVCVCVCACVCVCMCVCVYKSWICHCLYQTALAIGITGSIRVGQELGAGRGSHAKRIFYLVLIITCESSVGILVSPSPLLVCMHFLCIPAISGGVYYIWGSAARREACDWSGVF